MTEIEKINTEMTGNWENGMAQKNLTIDCRLCGQITPTQAWGGAECVACGSVSTVLVPSNETLSAFYNQFNQSYVGGGTSEGKNLKRYSRQYLKIINRYCKKGALIDIGSSTNPFPNDAQTAGFQVTALDYIKPKDISPLVKFVQGSIDDDNIDDEIKQRFDVVTAWAVAEHLPRPLVSAKIMANLCHSGGYIFLSTPEIGTFLTNHSIGRSGWFYPPEHLNLLSPVAISKIFQAHGCELIKWGRLELSPLRYFVRYGMGIAETGLGYLTKLIMPKKWEMLRHTKTHKFAGITYFVIKKH